MSSFKSGRTFTVSQTIACVADGKSILFSSNVNRFMDWPCFFSRADLRSLESTRAACNRHVRTCACGRGFLLLLLLSMVLVSSGGVIVVVASVCINVLRILCIIRGFYYYYYYYYSYCSKEDT